jgi:type II secretion system protein N
MMDRPLFRIGGYVLFGVVTFILALLLTFPDGTVKQIAAVQIEHRLEQSMDRNVEVEVGDLDLWWAGLALENLSITEPDSSSVPTDGGGGEGRNGGDNTNPNDDGDSEGGLASSGQPSLQITVPSIGARLAPISSLMNFGLSVKYHLGLGGGSLSGTYTRSSSAQSIYVSVNDLNLNQSPILVQYTGVPMFGTFTGEGTFQFAPNRPVVTDGAFELSGQKVTIGPKEELKLEAIPFGHVNIPQTNFGNMELELHIERREGQQPKVVLDGWRAKGRDVQLEVWGDVDLARRMANAEARLKLRVQLNPEFTQQNQAMGAMLNNEKMQNGKRGDWYGLVFWGPLRNMQWKGSPTAAAGPEKEGGKDGQKGGGKGKNKKKGAPKKK